MPRLTRVFWIVTLCLFAHGCTGFAPAILPSPITDSRPTEDENIVEVGSIVLIELYAGQVVYGEVIQIDDDSMVVHSLEGDHGADIVVEFEQIDMLEEFQTINPVTLAKVVITGGALGCMAILLIVGDGIVLSR